ncbi:hypothetical protein [Streptomyces sp. SPB074]|uniref:HD domain-containing protein n=1 Tax=Streptomyces sp. (strain SPB074) TaxID=465543 RepID=UPI00056CA627|nr:hypothetical protein [Streptomyces sp. SPB074]
MGGQRDFAESGAAYEELRAGFATTLLRVRGEAPGPAPEPYADELLARWAEPQRAYHTRDHLRAVLRHLDTLIAETARAAAHGTAAERAWASTVRDPGLVRLAAWFHDAVYRPDRSENEERSATLAERALGEAGLAAAAVAEVARLVRLTADHETAEGDGDGELLCDADLAVLAGSPQEYAAYAAAVAEEYGFLPEERFRHGRAEVLRHLLALPRLFRTPYGSRHWEQRARENLATELRLLGG